MGSGKKSPAGRLPAWHGGNALLLPHQPGSMEQFNPFCSAGWRSAGAGSLPSCSGRPSLLT